MKRGDFPFSLSACRSMLANFMAILSFSTKHKIKAFYLYNLLVLLVQSTCTIYLYNLLVLLVIVQTIGIIARSLIIEFAKGVIVMLKIWPYRCSFYWMNDHFHVFRLISIQIKKY